MLFIAAVGVGSGGGVTGWAGRVPGAEWRQHPAVTSHLGPVTFVGLFFARVVVRRDGCWQSDGGKRRLLAGRWRKGAAVGWVVADRGDCWQGGGEKGCLVGEWCEGAAIGREIVGRGG